MSPVRVSPSEPRPTHDFSLRDNQGRELGFRMCDTAGHHKRSYVRTPVERTALKTTSGNSQYSDLDYPYSPIVQDDWSGGRGLLDFERDGTRFYDSYRMRTGRSNKAYLAPQEQIARCVSIGVDQNLPGNVQFVLLTEQQSYIARRFQASANYTASLLWLLARRRASPQTMTISLLADNAGVPGALMASVAVPVTRLEDILSEWLDETIADQAISLGTFYWLQVNAGTASPADDTTDHWEIGVKPTAGSTYYSEDGTPGSWIAADWDLYFRVTPATESRTNIFFEYKEVMYAITSAATGAPTVWMNGECGAADPNTGQLSKLIDASKAWTIDQWAGCVVKITDGPGKGEWKRITSNTATELVTEGSWAIEHTVASEYVILGSNTWSMIAGHGLAAPVTDVLVSTTGVVYVCMGNAVTVRRLRAFNDAGTWRSFSDAACQADETATTKADYMTYKPQAQKIVLGSNSDVNGDVSVLLMSNASVPAWGAALTWDPTAVIVGSRYRKMNRLEVYPDDNGTEAIWVGKIDRPWIVPYTGNPYPIALQEMESVKSEDNFRSSLVHNVYLYFPLGNGVERYYRGQLDDVGVNLGEGLPSNRQGVMVLFAGYPGSFFAAVDAGDAGYSALHARDGNGWHEHYRAPKAKRIRGLRFQPIPGTTSDRLWLYVGNDFLWLPFPSGDTNELTDPNYLYTHEGALVLARMHAGMFDVQKVLRTIKLWTNSLEADVCWLEVDYRLDEATTWTPIERRFETSPVADVDLAEDEGYGLAAKRLQFRVRFYSTDASKTPVLLAAIFETVMRISVKFMYSLTFSLNDLARCIDRQPDDYQDAFKKLAVLDDWASDRSTGMLIMHSRSPLYDGRLVFLNPVQVTQLRYKRPNKARSKNILVCTTSAQDA